MAELIQACSTALILKLTLTCPWRSLYLHVCSVCVYMYILCVNGWGACVRSCACVRQESPCQKHSCLHSDAWFHSIWSIYPENEQPTFRFFFSPPVVSFSDTTPPSPFFLSFNSLYLIISSSPAVWLFPPVSNCARDTTWSSSLPLGMPLIPTFPSPSKVRSLDRSQAVELRDIFWWKHPADCSSFLLPLYVAGVSQRFRMDWEKLQSIQTPLFIFPKHLQKKLLLRFFGAMDISNDFLCVQHIKIWMPQNPSGCINYSVWCITFDWP